MSRLTQHYDADVLIAGGGPVGAMLAGYLGGRGIRTLLVEAGDGIVRDCRMHLVNIRSMEILRNLGLESELRECGWPADHVQDIAFVTALDGFEIARIKWPAIADMAPPPYSPTFNQRCPQFWFNPIMLAWAARQPDTEIRYHTELQGFMSDADGVTAELVGPDGERSSVRVKYLAGCDGPRSTVREVMGVDREGSEPLGQSVEVLIRSTELASRMSTGPAGRFFILNSRSVAGSFMPFDGKDLYRMTLMVQPTTMTIEAMHAEIRALTNDPFEYEVVSPLLPWTNRAVSASRYALDRVALAGDSAHSMPPTGGFGMNSGIQDAYDLGWRLRALVEGWGGPTLLESYDVERRMAIARVSEMAANVYQDWVHWMPKLRDLAPELEKSGAAADAFRTRIGGEIVTTFSREFNSQGGPLGYRYTDSPIVIPDGSPEPPDAMEVYVSVARPGHRAPHMCLADGRSTLDLFGHAFTLLNTTGDRIDDEWLRCAQRLSIPLQIVDLADPGATDVYGTGLILVRPDGIVSWRSGASALDPQAVLTIVAGHAPIARSALAEIDQPAPEMSGPNVTADSPTAAVRHDRASMLSPASITVKPNH